MVDRAVIHNQDTARLGPRPHVLQKFFNIAYKGLTIICTFPNICMDDALHAEGGKQGNTSAGISSIYENMDGCTYPGPLTNFALIRARSPLYAHPYSLYVVLQSIRLSSIKTSRSGDSAPIWKRKRARESSFRSAADLESWKYADKNRDV